MRVACWRLMVRLHAENTFSRHLLRNGFDGRSTSIRHHWWIQGVGKSGTPPPPQISADVDDIYHILFIHFYTLKSRELSPPPSPPKRETSSSFFFFFFFFFLGGEEIHYGSMKDIYRKWPETRPGQPPPPPPPPQKVTAWNVHGHSLSYKYNSWPCMRSPGWNLLPPAAEQYILDMHFSSLPIVPRRGFQLSVKASYMVYFHDKSLMGVNPVIYFSGSCFTKGCD